MNWKKILADYFTFSRKDRIGILALIGLIVIIYFLPVFFVRPAKPPIVLHDSLFVRPSSASSAASDAESEVESSFAYAYDKPVQKAVYSKAELFSFDPNTISADGWRRLGLKDKTIKTIHNYLSKGGKFYKPEDVQKIWGLPEGFYERVAGYIHITAAPSSFVPNSSYKPEKSEKKIITVNINEGDTTAFIALPGIGNKLAARIVNFREKLGGFYSADQIGEVYGVPDSTFQKIKPYLQVNASSVQKININTATKEALKTHPYIKWNIANALVEYRNQHGTFQSVQDVKKIVLIDDALFEKLFPYLSL